jgi:ornithine cyclodeaminase/alanine dehydrogenase-like protein (mu-crystallin family)
MITKATRRQVYSFSIMALVFLVDQYHAFTARVNSLLPSSSTTSLSSMNGAKVGFVGCGTIAAAIATGIATQTDVPIESIAVSRRSKAKSQALADEFPSLVTVYDDNQEILNCSDVIFICVLPDQTSSVLQGLSFDESRHSLISLVVS